MAKLAGMVAFVSGAGRGIGRAVALELAKAGADLALNDLPTSTDLSGVVQEVRGIGRRAVALPGDVSQQEAVEGCVDQAVAQLGRLDIAVTNAVFSDRNLFHLQDMDKFRRTIDVTMWGAFYLLRAATNRMLAQGRGGSIVVISSPHAFLAIPLSMAYNMAKAALDQMAKTAAIELAPHRIRVNTIYPGWTNTPGERKFISEEDLQVAARKLPYGRLAEPEEIARGVLFFCDPANSYVTGSALKIDGAVTLPWWAASGSGVPR